jgi:hypothetical protein
MFQPVATHRFALETHPGAYETWPGKSRLMTDGALQNVAVPGYALLHQFEIPDGYVLVTDFDCPYEEATSFILLSRGMELLAKRSFGAMYCTFLLDTLTWMDARHLCATFHGGDRWRIRILNPDLPLMRWRLAAERI